MRQTLKRQQGLGAIAILMLVVLLSLVGVYMNTTTTLSVLNTAGSGSSMQALFAARGGIEWGIYQALNRPACTCGTNCCTAGPAIDGATLNFTGGADNFSASLSCGEFALNEGGTNYCIFNISATAESGSPGDITYTRRRIRATVTDGTAP